MNNKFFLSMIIFWVIIIFGFIAVKEVTLRTGDEVVLRTAPVDPRDLFRGDYVILRYEISDITLSGVDYDINLREQETVYVTLDKSKGYGTPTRVTRKIPGSGTFIKGTITRRYDNAISLDYGIESYFVQEGAGRELERLQRGDLEVLVAINGRGNAFIKNLLYQGRVLD